MTGYFAGPKPGFAGKAASLAANEGHPKDAAKAAAPTNTKGDKRLVTVREHTRAIQVKKPPKPDAAGRLVANEKTQTPSGPLPNSQKNAAAQTASSFPSLIGDKQPQKTNTAPAKFTGPAYKGKPSGDFGEIGHLVSNVVHGLTKTGKPFTVTDHGRSVVIAPGKSLGAQAAAIVGLPPTAIEHPIRFIEQQRKLPPQGKADSAVGLHLLGAALAAPAAGRIDRAAAKRGQAVLFSGGGGKAREDAAAKAVGDVAAKDAPAALRAAVSGKPAKQALKTMGPNEKVGALIDNPNMGKSVRQLQKEQKQLYSQERAKRAAAANVHLNNQTLAPDERIRLAKNELKGELPKIKFQGFTELSEPAVTAMQKHILDHPHLMPFQKITASSALTNALTEGKLPTPSELKLLEHVFGKDATTGLAKLAEHPFRDTLLSTMNVPRSLMSSFDLSAPFRQGLVVSTRHPSLFAKNFKPMVKSFGSERVYQATLDDIQHRPSFPLMMRAKLSLTDLGHAVGDREERFASDIAEKLTGGKKYSPVRASGRAYTGFLDKTRADVFDHLIQRAQNQGINIHDDHFLESLGKYVNSATGRGDLGRLQEAGKVMNAVFFSPRLMASRLNFLNPAYYAKLHPFARKEALRSAIQLAGTVSTLLSLAAYGGAKVVSDPRNPDWGKIRVGNTRIDLAGGFQQYLRLFAQLATGTAISSTSGKKLNLTAGGFGQPNRLDLFLRFFEGKENPISSFVTDAARGQDQVGNKFHLKTEIQNRMIPLLAQDSHDLYKEHHGGLNGLAAAFAGYGVGSVGFGLQTYAPKPSKGRSKAPQDYFGASSGGSGSPYFASSSSSGNSGYFGTP